MARAMETASVRANRVTATAPLNSSRRFSRERSGIDRGGRLAGKAPTVLMPWTPDTWKATPNRLPPTMATIM